MENLIKKILKEDLEYWGVEDNKMGPKLDEDSKGENYMFFSNLKQMRRQIDMMLENFNPYWVDSTLADGHDWADDKISESKTNIDSVFDFFMNKKTDGEVEISVDDDYDEEFPVDDDYDDTEDYYTSHDKYGNPFNDYPK
jgi:hypothetical protein